MQSRIGPRGVTIEDVARVAEQGADGMPYTGAGGYTFSRPNQRPVSAQLPSMQKFLESIVGGPAPTYGEKYGGYPTLTMMKSAIEGIGAAVPLARRMAEQEAARREALLTETAMRDVSLAPDTAATRRLQEYNTTFGRPMAENPAVVSAQRELDRAIAEGAPAPDIEAARRMLQNANYGAAMERRNLTAFAGTEEGDFIDPTTGQPSRGLVTTPGAIQAIGATPIANLGRELAPKSVYPEVQRQLAERMAAEVDPYRQFASQIAEQPMSQYLQAIAQSRFGVDPALAAGLFGPETDINYMRTQRDLDRELMYQAYGIDPTVTMEDMILESQGPDALMEYRNAKLQAEMNRLNEGALTADEEMFDLELERITGVNPEDVATGDVATARSYLANPDFQELLAANISAMQSTPFATVEEKKNYARQLANDYYVSAIEMGTPSADAAVAAEIMLNAIVRFDFLNYTEG